MEQILLGHLENKKVVDDSQCDFTKANLTNLVAFYEHLPVTKGRLKAGEGLFTKACSDRTGGNDF